MEDAQKNEMSLTRLTDEKYGQVFTERVDERMVNLQPGMTVTGG